MSLVDFIKNAPVTVVAYAYRHSRRQFWPALYVLLYAGFYCAGVWLLFWLISAVTPMSLALNWRSLGGLVAVVATGELVRGHVRQRVNVSPGNWSAIASLVGGVVAGLVVSALAVVNLGVLAWYEPIVSAAFGAFSYLVLGWLIQYQARQQEAKQ